MMNENFQTQMTKISNPDHSQLLRCDIFHESKEMSI